MPRLVLVRHGEAAAGWGADVDPGLSEQGRAQADAAAAAVAPLGPLAVVVSPLRRTRETAAPLERHWGIEARVDAGVGEIPSPDDTDLEGRAAWLRALMGRGWADAEPSVQTWRQTVLDTLCAIGTDSVVVSHFVAINVAVGAATGDDRVMCFAPANCSRTIVETDGGALRLVELGDQGATAVR